MQQKGKQKRVNISHAHIQPQKSKNGYFLDFGDTKMGPYKTLHFKNNLFYNEKEERRGNTYFPFSPEGNTTEIFLLQKEIVIATLQRKNIHGEMKNFIDIINTSQKIKMRLEVSSVLLIFNTKINNLEILVINYEKNGKNETLKIDVQTLKIIEKKEKTLSCSFNEISYDIVNNKSLFLNYVGNDGNISNINLDGYFDLREKNETRDFFYAYKYPIKKITRFFLYQYHLLDELLISFNLIGAIGLTISMLIKSFFCWIIITLVISFFYYRWLESGKKGLMQGELDGIYITPKYLIMPGNPKITKELQLYKHTSQDEKLKKHIQNFLTYEKPYAITPEDKQKVILNNK